MSLPQERSTAGLVSYTWVARSRSGSSALALNKPSSSSSSSSSSSLRPGIPLAFHVGGETGFEGIYCPCNPWNALEAESRRGGVGVVVLEPSPQSLRSVRSSRCEQTRRPPRCLVATPELLLSASSSTACFLRLGTGGTCSDVCYACTACYDARSTSAL